ncbi:DctP family TRAP transporter solute-binding subunit [Azospirillum lipoferum]|uniref:TRAP dicarboxylate transporter, periplasmic component (DctP-like) n=1 Tax=Azospirillum lipoferum (strain 4B) TaxID=862719 RepID=G7Z9S0_AZOL4|nr:DctP family TRAP transporter solute-binding subunit [Azospirillum lipoferum]CBS87726.1 TRAP dicarboxylate transporter, periplasmic component (DctP-like) [Azospirillum lipoferum 4B]
MKSLKALLAGIALAALTVPAVLAGSATAADYKAEYKLSTVLGKPFPWGIGGDRWAELVKEKTNGRINIKMYPGTSLVNGDQTKEFTALRQGTIDMAVGSTINWSPQVKELNLFSLPFLMPDHKALDALTKGEVGKKLFDLLATKDVVPLAWGENGFREISNSKHPIRTPADLKGLKIRVVGSPLYLDTFSALGANPTQMSWADAQPALSTGAVDGQENPLTIFVAAKLATLGQKNLTLWGYVADPLIFVVNKEVWASWSKEDQEAVRAAAVQAAAEEVALSRKGITAEDDSLLKDIAAQGVEVVRLTPDQQKAFQTATQPVFDKWTKQIGPDLVKAAQTAIAERK